MRVLLRERERTTQNPPLFLFSLSLLSSCSPRLSFSMLIGRPRVKLAGSTLDTKNPQAWNPPVSVSSAIRTRHDLKTALRLVGRSVCLRVCTICVCIYSTVCMWIGRCVIRPLFRSLCAPSDFQRTISSIAPQVLVQTETIRNQKLFVEEKKTK